MLSNRVSPRKERAWWLDRSGLVGFVLTYTIATTIRLTQAQFLAVGAETTPFVLGAIPLIVLALDRYAEPIGAFHRYRISIETFRADLVLQHRSLHRTLSAIGLGESPSFEELKSRFENFYPDICSELITFIGRMDQVIADLMKDLNVNLDVEVGITYTNLIESSLLL
jgi:hypothetical protein